MLPFLALLRWPLAWTVLISVVAGYLPELDATFSLARALGLLPFFTLGWWLREHDLVQRLGLLRRPWWTPVAAGAVFVGALIAAVVFADVWRDVRLGLWMFYSYGYGALDAPQWWAGVLRLALIVIALVLCAAFFAVVPRRTQWWTHFGRYTMYVYLLHSFVLYPFRQSGLLGDLRPEWLWLPLVVAGSAALSLGLASTPVRRVFRPLVEPRPAWLFADRTLAGREGRRDDPTGARRPRDPARADPRQNG